ncbi:L,D-transpeptidase [Cohnella fermenti]|uniref:L,D-transpeptidase n=1 Tax=Cohnella fermenti TaxID=2565925 RepID=A0A4S4C7L0_9BACL|nr:L,D-transpeptidase [Cohnella fermenti]THF83881.1 L,D-transpeptidase [Cohnella fermenti]
MSQDDKLEKLIDEFYEHSPELGDSLPMKDYLLKHENNEMAWYLLGKQYAAKGEEGKANYCFAQAGAVYEAFESKENPLRSAGRPTDSDGAGRAAGRKRRLRGWIIAGVLLLLTGVGAAVAGEEAAAPAKQAELAAGAETGTGTPSPEAGQAEPAKPTGTKAAPAGGKTGGSASGGDGGKAAEKRLAYVAGAADAQTDGALTLGRLLLADSKQGNGSPSVSLLVQTPVLAGKWTDWQRSGLPLAEVEAASGEGEAAVDWFASGWCPCQAGQGADNAAARQAVAVWKPLQEEKLVLRSAINLYKTRTGKWPASGEQLAAAYPNNSVAGWNERMEAWFAELSEELTKVDGKLPAAAGWPAASGPAEGSGKPSGSLAPLAEQPLEIIVDKSKHRLAVVSGNVLLRNYEVGLGAERTPEGTFYITEKVRNPNGTSTGAFGSRGMTLSDTLYAIHGTDDPDSIGKDESKGCIRMAKEDLEELYDLASLGTKVTITAKGLPQELRTPTERFRLPPSQDETNPNKKYEWLN